MKEAIITSSILIICIAVLRRLCRGKISAVMQYSLWLIVAVRLIVPVFAAAVPNLLPESKFSVINVTEKLEDRVQDYVQLSERIHIGQVNMNLPVTHTGADGPTAVFMAGQIGYTWIDFFKGIWYVGIVMAAVWMFTVNILFMRRLHRDRVKLEIEESKLPVYSVKELSSPCLYGLPGRLSVYIPEEIVGDEEKVSHILAHEYCHYKHRDVFWAAFRCMLIAVYWFNPFTWLAAVLSKQDCELACDEAAIKILGEDERIAYGKTLLSLITKKTRPSDIVCAATTMTAGGKGIKERIKLIAEKPHRIALALIPILIVVGIMSAVTFTQAKTYPEGLYILEGKNSRTVTTSCFQVTFQHDIDDKLYYMGENDTDVIIYHKKYNREIGRFIKISLKEAMELSDEREIVVIGDYGQNKALKNHIDGGSGAISESEHYYYIYTENENDDTGVTGTDSNNETDAKSSGYADPIPAPENVEHELLNLPYDENVDYSGEDLSITYTPSEETHTYIPNEEGVSQSGSADTNTGADEELSPSEIVLPDEEIKVVYTPIENNLDAMDGCYVYVPADNSDAAPDMREELYEINRLIIDMADSVAVIGD